MRDAAFQIRDLASDEWITEPPTYDEALAAKCDAQAREDEARRLKGMV